MAPVLVLVGVAGGAFVSTNLDAFLVLVANVARAPRSRGAAAGGFVVATPLVLAAAWALAGASAVIPPARAGLIGVVPLGMGLKQVFDLVRLHRKPRRDAAPDTGAEAPPVSADTLGLGEAVVLHLSLSADNLAVYSALLTDTMPHFRPIVAATTLALTVVWAGLARAALRVPALSAVLLRHGRAIMAVLLVVVGVYILVDTETDVPLPATRSTMGAPTAAPG
jgi:cadmium resistance protein CadD (predicted permease)